MRLVQKKYDQYDPMFIFMGIFFAAMGSYALLRLGLSGPPIVWLLRAIFGIPVAIGIVMLVRQYQLRPRS